MRINRQATIQVEDDKTVTIAAGWDIDGERVTVNEPSIAAAKEAFNEKMALMGVNNESYGFSISMSSKYSHDQG